MGGRGRRGKASGQARKDNGGAASEASVGRQKRKAVQSAASPEQSRKTSKQDAGPSGAGPGPGPSEAAPAKRPSGPSGAGESDEEEDEVLSDWSSDFSLASSEAEDDSEAEELEPARQRWTEWANSADESRPPPPVPIVPAPDPDLLELGLAEDHSEEEYQRNLAYYRKMERDSRHKAIKAGVNWRRKAQATALALGQVRDQALARTGLLDGTDQQQEDAAKAALGRLQQQLVAPGHPVHPQAPLKENKWSWDADTKSQFHYPFLSKSGPLFDGYVRPSELLKKFVGHRAVQIILEATNKRLKERLARQLLSRQQDGKRVHDDLHRIHAELDENEFWKWQGVTLYMTQAPLRSWESYWRRDECPSLLPSANFSKRRYEAILLSLSPTPPHEERAGKQQLSAHKHVEELTEALVRQWNRVYAAPAQISADETLTRYHGRFKYKQAIPTKPAGEGLKFYTLASSEGVAINTFLSTSDRNLPRAEELGSVAAIIFRLLDGVSGKHHYFKGHRLMTDNYYSSVSLFRRLLMLGVFGVGTTKTSTGGVPRVLAVKKAGSDVAKLARGTSITVSAPGLLLSLWCDSKPVVLLSAEPEYGAGDMGSMFRRVKGRSTPAEVEAPLPFVSYNSFMGGVDQNDQAVGRLRQRRSYVKWTQRALDHLLAVSYANAATVHLRYLSVMEEAQKLRKKWDSRHYYMEAIKGLLEDHGGTFPDIMQKRAHFAQKNLLNAMEFKEKHQNVSGKAGLCVVCRKRAKNLCVCCTLKLHARVCHDLYHKHLRKNIEKGIPNAAIKISKHERAKAAAEHDKLKAIGKACRFQGPKNISGWNGTTKKKERDDEAEAGPSGLSDAALESDAAVESDATAGDSDNAGDSDEGEQSDGEQSDGPGQGFVFDEDAFDE